MTMWLLPQACSLKTGYLYKKLDRYWVTELTPWKALKFVSWAEMRRWSWVLILSSKNGVLNLILVNWMHQFIGFWLTETCWIYLNRVFSLVLDSIFKAVPLAQRDKGALKSNSWGNVTLSTFCQCTWLCSLDTVKTFPLDAKLSSEVFLRAQFSLSLRISFVDCSEKVKLDRSWHICDTYVS